MLVILVNDAFETAVNAIADGAELPIQLGSRLIDKGEHAGERLVSCALFNSCPEWRQLIQQSASGGTALENGKIVIEVGRTIQFTDPQGGVWGPFEVMEVSPEELSGWFNEEELE